MNESDFRALYPEFSSVVNYPAVQVQSFLDMAYDRLRAELWGSSLAQGIGLYVAHNLAMRHKQQTAASSGNVGVPFGIMNHKAVGPVSVGYDVTATMVKNGGSWNLTSYGQQFIYIATQVGHTAGGQYYGT